MFNILVLHENWVLAESRISLVLWGLGDIAFSITSHEQYFKNTTIKSMTKYYTNISIGLKQIISPLLHVNDYNYIPHN